MWPRLNRWAQWMWRTFGRHQETPIAQMTYLALLVMITQLDERKHVMKPTTVERAFQQPFARQEIISILVRDDTSLELAIDALLDGIISKKIVSFVGNATGDAVPYYWHSVYDPKRGIGLSIIKRDDLFDISVLGITE